MRNTLETLYLDHLQYLQDSYYKALASHDYDALLIHSGRPARQSVFDDQYWPFRPTPAFAHWLPLRAPDVALLLEPGKRPRLFSRVVTDYWEGEPEPESHHFRESFDAVTIQELDEVRQHLPGGRIAFIGDLTEPAAAYGLDMEAANPEPLLLDLDQVRVSKTDYERECIAEANRRAAAGHRAVRQAFLGGDHSELQLHLLYLGATNQDDSETPYKNIVALDEHAAVLHHINYSRSRPINQHQSLLVDAGAMCLGYASDITRTAAKGAGSENFSNLVTAMEELQAKVIEKVAPGLPYQSLHDQAHHLLAQVLGELGIARTSADELVESGATRKFFPHGLGHSLGLQVHDVGCRLQEPTQDNPFLRNTSTIAAGQVFTIEPGCYFIPQLMDELRELPVASHIDWKAIDALSYYGGVRIEDNIAVTEAGTVNITRDNWPSTP